MKQEVELAPSFFIRSNTFSVSPSTMTSSGTKIGDSSALASGSTCFLAFSFRVGDGKVGPQRTKRLGAAPCDRLIVGYADDQPLLAFERDFGFGINRDIYDTLLLF